MSLHPDSIYQKLVEAGEAWARLDAAATLLEESKKCLIAELGNETDGSMNAKEAYAYRHPRYKEHITAMVSAREAATLAKVDYEARKAWCDLMRTKAANERAALREAP